MAEGVVSLLLEVVIGFAQREITKVSSARHELNKLQQELKSLQPILRDAHTKQFTSKEIKDWILRLNDVAYDALDIIDLYRIQKRSDVKWANDSKQPKARKTLNSLFKSGKKMYFLRELSEKIKEINDRLSILYKEKDLYGLVPLMEGLGFSTKTSEMFKRCQSTGAITESNIIGREKNKESPVKLLVDEAQEIFEESFVTVAIVGMGGVGKTTLAKMVYNNETVSENFEKRMWVCVSESPNQRDLFKKILEEVDEKERCSNQSIGLNAFQSQISKHLKNKKFLLVLDDVWDYAWWYELRGLWGGCRLGSRVMITTRDVGVANAFKSDYLHELRGLNDEQSWRLFANEALRRDEKEEELNEVRGAGLQIVRKCGGLPLALTTVGGMMRLKERRRPVWHDILNSSLWSWKGPLNENNIFASIALSYMNIPFPLKQCLTYCCIFPKDFQMNGDMLVRLLVAEGLIAKEEGRELEVVAESYLKELVDCNLILVDKDDRYTLHDLVHDFALYIRGEELITTDLLETEKFHPHARTFSLVKGEEGCGFEMLTKQKLRSLVLQKVDKFSFNGFAMLKWLRVLDLSGSNVLDLPVSIGDLILLRYLNLSNTKILELPESIVNLHDLQTLDLSRSHVKRLPDKMSSLSSLRHLDLSCTNLLEYLPKEIGKLTGLQTLGRFVVTQNGAGEKGCSLEELHDLNNLRGVLEIEHLESICSPQESQRAQLQNKEYLQYIKLSCGVSTIMEFDEAFSRKIEDVYETLQPPREILYLCIRNYAGCRLPTWMNTIFCCLKDLYLMDCRFLESLPSLEYLPKLVTLYLQGLDRVKVLDTKHGFPKLESLALHNLRNLEEWRSDVGTEIMPSLRIFTIGSCPKLTTFPLVLTLEELIVYSAPNWEGRPMASDRELPHIKSLQIQTPCFNLRRLVSCPVLENLDVFGCDELVELPCSTALRKVSIKNCSKACFSLPDDAVCDLRNLTKLEIIGSPKATTLLEWLPFMHQLESLVVESCLNVTSLPDGFHPVRLRMLSMRDLPQLQSLPSSLFNNIKTLEELKLGPQLGSVTMQGILQHLRVERLRHLALCGFEDLAIDSFEKMLLSMSCLEGLVIEECPHLLSLVDVLQEHVLQKLRFLQISSVKNEDEDSSFFNFSRSMPLVYFLSINSLAMSSKLSRLVSLRDKVQALSIRLLPGVESIPEWVQQLDQLKHLAVRNSEGITNLPNSLNKLSRLQMLELDCLPELRSLPPAMASLCQLEIFFIHACSKLSCLPDWVHGLPRLEVLHIRDCDNLVARC